MTNIMQPPIPAQIPVSPPIQGKHIGLIQSELIAIKSHLHMGDVKEALTKVNDILKYMETEMGAIFHKAEDEIKKEL